LIDAATSTVDVVDSEKARCFCSANGRSWPVTSVAAMQRYFWSWMTSGHCADIANVSSLTDQQSFDIGPETA
jgi:hypothetical protein